MKTKLNIACFSDIRTIKTERVTVGEVLTSCRPSLWAGPTDTPTCSFKNPQKLVLPQSTLADSCSYSLIAFGAFLLHNHEADSGFKGHKGSKQGTCLIYADRFYIFIYTPTTETSEPLIVYAHSFHWLLSVSDRVSSRRWRDAEERE